METNLRDTGIEVLGQFPWGTHFCQFYRTKKDLVEILIPYFRAGLAANEFCLWITSEPLKKEEAYRAIASAIPQGDESIKSGQIEILPYEEWYLKDGKFDPQTVLRSWVEKMESALQHGYAGLRLSANTFWLEKKDWNSFTEYESEVHKIISNYRMLALCTYNLTRCSATEIIDVIQNHEFALIKQEGKWELFENSAYKVTKEALLQTREKFERLYLAMSEGVALHQVIYDPTGKPVDYIITDVNPAYESILGLKRESVIGKKASEVYRSKEPPFLDIYARMASSGESTSFESYFAPMKKHFSISVFSIQKGQFATVFSDITARKQTEEKIRQQADEWKMTFNSLTDMISIQDREFRLVRVNKAYEEAVKMKEADLIGKRCYEVIHGLSCPQINCPHHQTVVTGKTITTESFEPRLGLFIEATTSPIFDDNGEVRGTVHVIKNITERKIADEMLKQSQKDLNHAQAVSHTGSWRLNVQQNELTWSDETYRIFKIPAGTPMNYEKFLSLIYPEDRDYVNQKWQAALKGEAYDIEHRIVTGNEIRWVREKAELEYDEQGNLSGGFGTVQDITERKRMEEALQFEADKLKNILNSMEDGVYIVNRNYDIEYINPAMQARFGELNSQKCYQYLHDRQDVCPWCRNQEVFSGNRIHWELFFPRANGTFEITGIPMRNSAGEITKLEILHDITERKKAEERIQKLNQSLLQRTAELEFANRELEAFSYSVSHDLRSPLRSIDGFSQALLEDYSALLDDQGKDCLRRIRQSSQLMSELIDDLLSLSRATMTELHLETINLSETAEQIAAHLQSEDPARQVKWVIQSGLQASGDPRLVHQLLENLLSNAFKFTARTPQAQIEFGGKTLQNEIIYYVKDNGAGFDMAYSGKLFKPFQRLHSSSEYPGTGIGLALVQRIVIRHGGRVWAEAEPGKGACFYFTLKPNSTEIE